MTNKTHGFTLLEILIVLIIIGLVSTTVLQLRRSSTSEDLYRGARLFEAQFKLARQLAIFKRTVLMLILKNNKLQYLAFNEQTKTWNLVSNATLNKTVWASDIHLNWLAKTTKVMLFPNGDITPFNLNVSIDHPKINLVIMGRWAGSIAIGGES